MIAVSILEECVQAAVGRGGHRGTIKALYRESCGPETTWESSAAALWRRHDLPRRNITLILPRQAAITNEIIDIVAGS